MKMAVVILMLGLIALLSGCETMKGFGKDVQKAGEWVEEKAE